MGLQALNAIFFCQKLIAEWYFSAVLIEVHLCCVEYFGNINFEILNKNENPEFGIPIKHEIITVLSEN